MVAQVQVAPAVIRALPASKVSRGNKDKSRHNSKDNKASNSLHKTDQKTLPRLQATRAKIQVTMAPIIHPKTAIRAPSLEARATADLTQQAAIMGALKRVIWPGANQMVTIHLATWLKAVGKL